MQALLGVNWKTTLAGITALLAIAAKIIADFKAKNFVDVFSDIQGLLTDIAGIGIGIGLLHAKDDNTTTNPLTGVAEKANPTH